ncbi:MAG TPA: glutamine-hydrolyzing GMP synthase [Acidobacteriota bacterium]|nr:glutamine-hydrolyzing GMP synthase [Acidobacteriota bacterium]HNH82856.1 glutamine-hydrolyzing GMP synthase [Acidobacteriota bacterium]
MLHTETVLILDFGSQYTQLIGRRVRELNIYCEILPFHTSLEAIQAKNPRAIILSGGPSSVYGVGAPHCSPDLLNLGVPVLGICYGMQILASFLDGKVESSNRREFGAADIQVETDSRLFAGLPRQFPVWMSHGDHVTAAPSGFTVSATSSNALGAMEDPRRGLYAIQFHPEVVHTPHGKDILRNFLVEIAGINPNWTMRGFIEQAVEAIREQVGDGHAVCGLSGGVDSTVAAVLVSKAIGHRLTCLFVDNGVLRLNEYEDVLETFRTGLHLNVRGIPASDRFLSALAGVSDPEQKRKIIGREFIEVFQDEAQKLGKIDFLVQGTLYPDVIESVSVKGPSAVIKSHHNVGGLPDTLHLKLVEPLRELFKDEVRALGRELGIPEIFITRQPFPGPGLAVRILGEVTLDRVFLLQKADRIVEQEIRQAGLYESIWQAFAVLLPVQSVGVMGDERTYEYTVAIRAVESQDGMTADWVRLPYDVLHRISSRIVSEVRGINRVVYDISSKPPATIEWE